MTATFPSVPASPSSGHANHRRERLVCAADRADTLRRAPGEPSVLGLGQRHLLPAGEAAVLPHDVERPGVVVDGDLRDQIPVRTPWPSSGSVTPAGNMRSTTIGVDQVSPLSVERITSAVKPRFLRPRVPDQVEHHHQVTVRQHHDLVADRLVLVARVEDRLDRVVGHAVVVGAGKPGERPERRRPFSGPGARVEARRHDALPGGVDEGASRVGFAVMVSLSLKKFAWLSRLMTTGSLQLAPPSVDRDAITALSTFESLMPREICCATPLGENETHGSVARS